MNDAARDEMNGEVADERAEQESLIAAYALGNATVIETVRARQIIADDADAARLYEQFAAIASVLPEIYAETEAAPAPPSAALKERVLAAARAETRDIPALAASHAIPTP